MAAAADVSAPRAPTPFVGGLPQFSSDAGFLAEDFAALVLAVGGAALAHESTARFRRIYSSGSAQRDVDNRLGKLKVRGCFLVGADDRPLVPAELFTLTIPVAALTVYKASSPFRHVGKDDCAAILEEIKRHVFAGGRTFGAIRLEHVERVLKSSVPVAGGKDCETTALSLSLRSVPLAGRCRRAPSGGGAHAISRGRVILDPLRLDELVEVGLREHGVGLADLGALVVHKARPLQLELERARRRA